MLLPTFGGNWVDLVIIVFLVFYAWEGLERGFLVLLGEMISFVTAFVVALRFYPQAARLLSENFSLPLEYGKALGFILVAIMVEAILGMALSGAYRRIPHEWLQLRWNKILGFLPGLVDGLILVGFVSTAVIGLPISGPIKHDVLESRIGGALVSRTRVFEKSLNDVFGGAIQQTLSFLTVSPGGSESVDLHFQTNQYSVDTASEMEMLGLVNIERQSRGLGPLVMDGTLQKVARDHGSDMFLRGYFSHINPDGQDPFDRMRAGGVQFQTAGENLAFAPSVEIAHEGLMNSPGHRANILQRGFGRVGIGVIDGGPYGKMYTQDFTE